MKSRRAAIVRAATGGELPFEMPARSEAAEAYMRDRRAEITTPEGTFLTMPRRPAEAFPPGLFLREEMTARGWTTADVATRMGEGRDYDIDYFCIELCLYVANPGLMLSDDFAAGLATAFGISAETWLNLDRAWREWAKSRPQIKEGG